MMILEMIVMMNLVLLVIGKAGSGREGGSRNSAERMIVNYVKLT